MNKQVLKFAVIVFVIMGISILIYTISTSINSPKEVVIKSHYKFDISDLQSGQLLDFEVNGHSLYVYKPTEKQWIDLHFLTKHVWNPLYSGYDNDRKIFVYWGTNVLRCKLQQLNQKAPDSNKKWLGGYFDPCSEVSYDFAGRTLKTTEYTYNGFYYNAPNLPFPAFEIKDTILSVNFL